MTVYPCPQCQPPLVDDAKADYYQCPVCSFRFRLDREARTWWPEAEWDNRNVTTPVDPTLASPGAITPSPATPSTV